MTEDPKVGDIVCYDENRKIRFIALDTFKGGTFPTAWETLGVVVIRKGNQVKVCSKKNKVCRQVEVYPYIVSSYELDGAEHTATMKLHGSDTLDFKYTATTDAEFLEDLKSFLVDNGFTDWSAYIMDGRVILQYDNYTGPEDSSTTTSDGILLTAKFTVDIPDAQPAFWRKCGNFGNGLCNIAKVKESFMFDDSNPASNPSTDISSVPSYPICWPAFAGTSQYQEDHCLWLRKKYCMDPDNPTLEDWERYLDDLTHVIPYMTGGNAPKWRDGKVLSNMVKGVSYMSADGTQKKLYPAVDYCTGFLGGQGYLPSIAEFVEAFGNVTHGLSGVTMDKADPINRSLYVIGGNTVSCGVTYHVSGRNAGDTIWVIGSGAVAGARSYSMLVAVPFATIELPLTD